MQTLEKNSSIYYREANIYEQFSTAEDYYDIVYKEVSKLVNGNVLDVGCGTGKLILKLLENTQKINFFGVDISDKQLKIFKNKLPATSPVKLYQSDSCSLPFDDNTFDCIVSSWVLGTIEDDNKRDISLKEMKRTLKNNGIIILVENWHNDEFEKIIRGYNLINKIDSYDFWIKRNKFKIYKEIHTKFHFDNIEIAKEVFATIWDSSVAERILSNEFSHNIRIYILKNLKK